VIVSYRWLAMPAQEPSSAEAALKKYYKKCDQFFKTKVRHNAARLCDRYDADATNELLERRVEELQDQLAALDGDDSPPAHNERQIIRAKLRELQAKIEACQGAEAMVVFALPCGKVYIESSPGLEGVESVASIAQSLADAVMTLRQNQLLHGFARVYASSRSAEHLRVGSPGEGAPSKLARDLFRNFSRQKLVPALREADVVLGLCDYVSSCDGGQGCEATGRCGRAREELAWPRDVPLVDLQKTQLSIGQYKSLFLHYTEGPPPREDWGVFLETSIPRKLRYGRACQPILGYSWRGCCLSTNPRQSRPANRRSRPASRLYLFYVASCFKTRFPCTMQAALGPGC
jgi:hypothetical protein